MRRFVWYSRRGLLFVTIIVAAIAIGWFVLEFGKARRQAKVVETITKHGGAAVYDYQFSGSPSQFTIRTGATPPGPAWLNQLLGQDFLSSVVYVNLSHTSIDDADLANFVTLRRL